MQRVGSRLYALLDPARPYVRSVNQRYHSDNYRAEFNRAGEDFFAADWDTLVILDACRYDTFADHCTISGELSKRVSRGSMTVEFLKGNIAGREFLDTVYVTANGQFYNYQDILDATFHHVENVWRQADAWNSEHHTVLPETTTTYARKAAERFPNKRLVVHYIQPHYPFIDSPIVIDDAFDPEQPDFWNRVWSGEFDYDPEVLRDAYESNLVRALPHVADLVASLNGKTVVTSDHGNMLGDRARPIPIREWGHPQKLWVPTLTEVPWLETVTHPRPEITAEEPTEAAARSGQEDREDGTVPRVEEHLEHLGYKQ